jgi:hypothetical protein
MRPRRRMSMQPTVSVQSSAMVGGKKRHRHAQIAPAACSRLARPKRGMTTSASANSYLNW